MLYGNEKTKAGLRMRPKNEFAAVLLLCVGVLGIRLADGVRNTEWRFGEESAVYTMAPIADMNRQNENDRTVTLRDWAEKRYYAREKSVR